LSPLRYPHHQQQGVLVSPPSKPNHFAFKLFKKYPVPPSPGDNGKCPIPPPGLNCSSVTDDDDGIISSPPLVPVFPSSSLLSATTKPRRKSSQLGGSEVVASLKRSRSTMRQDLSSLLPLINNSTSNSSSSSNSVAKKNNCDSSSSSNSNSSMFQQKRSSAATDVAETGAMLPPLALAVEFSSGASDDQEVPSRVLRDRNAEKSAAPPSLDAWHRYRYLRVGVGGSVTFLVRIQIPRGSVPLTNRSDSFLQ
jgi:hypothetical protein